MQISTSTFFLLEFVKMVWPAFIEGGHHRIMADAFNRIAEGDLGTVTAIRIVYCCWVDPDWSRGTGENWRADQTCAGGGAVCAALARSSAPAAPAQHP